MELGSYYIRLAVAGRISRDRLIHVCLHTCIIQYYRICLSGVRVSSFVREERKVTSELDVKKLDCFNVIV